MTNQLMMIYNLDGEEKQNTPRKIAFHQINLITIIIIIGKFIEKTKKQIQMSIHFQIIILTLKNPVFLWRVKIPYQQLLIFLSFMRWCESQLRPNHFFFLTLLRDIV